MNIFATYAQEFSKKEDVNKYYTPSTPVMVPTY